MSSQVRFVVKAAAVAALSIVAIRALQQLVLELVFQSQSSMNGDATMYLAVGRGILNGLVPYRDLLESKPPGMFLVSALSLALGGDERFAILLQVFALAAIPISFVAFAIYELRAKDCFSIAFGGLVAFIFGAALVTYVGEKAGHFQTESFGAFFALLYLVVIAWPSPKIGWRRILLAAALLLACIGMKEPFLLSVAAAALLLTDDWRSFLRSFGILLVIGGAVGIVTFGLIGYLGPYVFIYLPLILGRRLPTTATLRLGAIALTADQPLWLRGFKVVALYADFLWFKPLPLLGVAIAFLCVSVPVWKCSQARTRWLIAAMLTISTWVLLFHLCFLLFDTFLFMHFRIPWRDPFVLTLGLELGGLFVLCSTMLAILYLKAAGVGSAVFRVIVAVYLVTLAVGSGGNFGLQHYVFAVPVYAAAFMCFVRCVKQRRTTHFVQSVVAVLAVLVALSMHAPTIGDPGTPQATFVSTNPPTAAMKVRATKLDFLMDACDYQRYIAYGTDVVAFTRHSPYDLSWTHVLASSDDPEPRSAARVLQHLLESPLVVIGNGDLKGVTNRAAVDAIQRQFRNSPSACAKAHFPIPGLTVLFRRNPESEPTKS